MSDRTCDCCTSVSERPEANETGGYWLGEESVLEARLPRELARAMGDGLGIGPIETLDEFVSFAHGEAGHSFDVDDLCHAATETPHYARLGGETHHLLCFLDAVVLAYIADEPVEFHTESPAGNEIEGRIAPTGALTTTPDGVVMSFGASFGDGPTGVATAEATPVEAAICPYVRAFTGREAYEEWTERVAVPTVGMVLDAGVSFAGALAGARDE